MGVAITNKVYAVVKKRDYVGDFLPLFSVHLHFSDIVQC